MKLVVPEQGSAQARSAWTEAERVLSSPLLYPEARSAVGRAARAGRLDRRRQIRARAAIEQLWDDVDRVPLTEALARQGGEIAESHGLRAYDAVHLASALAAGDGTVLVAADGDLLSAARTLGLTTVLAG